MTCDYRGLRQQSIVVRNTYSSYLGKLICRHLFLLTLIFTLILKFEERNGICTTENESALLIKRLIGRFAVRTGLEPATSAVTGRHSNQLNYRTRF